MKNLVIAAGLLFLGACGKDRSVRVVGTVGVDVPVPVTTELLVEAKNFDPYDYAVWLEWQDEFGVWQQTYLFEIFGDSSAGYTQNFEFLLVRPETTYYVLLADPDGTLWDSYPIWVPFGIYMEVSFEVEGGLLFRMS